MSPLYISPPAAYTRCPMSPSMLLEMSVSRPVILSVTWQAGSARQHDQGQELGRTKASSAEKPTPAPALLLCCLPGETEITLRLQCSAYSVWTVGTLGYL